MSGTFWTTWEAVARAVILCAGGYFAMLLLLRASGKRSTSKLNMFDWAVTVALGSLLASLALSTSIPLAAGVAAFATLIGLQHGIAWLTSRSEVARRVVKAQPALLYHRGEFLRGRMREERVAEEEILAAVREAGYGSMESVQAVVLETDGELSVLVEDVEGLRTDNFEGVHTPDAATAGPAGSPGPSEPTRDSDR